MKIKIFISFFGCLILGQSSQAEYRAFLLRITSATGDVTFTKSNLDPLQYVGYYPIQAGSKVTYDETWMCRGRTDNKTLCDNPNPPKVDPSNATKALDQSPTQASLPKN